MVKARWLFVALLSVPLIDALALFWVAGIIGWLETVLLVVLTALIGTIVVRAEGRRTIRKIQRSLAQGNPPTNELIDGGLLIAAGALLLTPGLVTDAIGFAFVFPLTRIPIRMALKKYVITPMMDRQSDGFATGNVYTFGFPNADAGAEDRRVDPEDFDLGGTSVDPDDSAGDDEGTIDLDSDQYEVESDGPDEFDPDSRS